jgi:hypothetical protein
LDEIAPQEDVMLRLWIDEGVRHQVRNDLSSLLQQTTTWRIKMHIHRMLEIDRKQEVAALQASQQRSPCPAATE